MRKLPGRDYDARPGASIYPVETGTVFILDKTRTFHNLRANARIEHRVFLWILWRGKSPKRKKTRTRKKKARIQDAPVTTFWLYVPVMPGFQFNCISRQKKFKLRSITKTLAGGYQILGKRVIWNYEPKNARRFYSVVSNNLGFPVG